MTYSTEDHLRRLEQKVQLLARINLTLILLFAFGFAAFAWQSKDKPAAVKSLGQLGRYQVVGAGGGDSNGRQGNEFVILDTRSGIVKPIARGSLSSNMFKRFDEIKR